MATLLRRAIGHLPELEQRLIHVRYFRESSLREAGLAVGVGKTLASRLHKRALDRLRAEILNDSLGDCQVNRKSTITIRVGDGPVGSQTVG